MEVTKWDVFEAAETGDLATLERFFAQRATLDAALAVEARVTSEAAAEVDIVARTDLERQTFPIDAWVDLHDRQTNVFLVAIRAHQFEAVQWLFTSPTTAVLPHTLRFFLVSAATEAARKGESEMLEMLLTSSSFTGEDNPDTARTKLLSLLLRAAIDSRNISVLDVALAHGADVNRELLDRSMPLSKAASSDETGEAVTRLLQAGAFTVDAGVAIHRAVENGHRRTIPILLEHGIDPRWVDQGNESALHRAAQEGYFRVIKALLQTTWIDIDAESEEGETALSLAVKENPFESDDVYDDDEESCEPVFHPMAIEMLLKHGANPEIESDGRSVLGWATCMGNTSVMRTLLDYGARMSTCPDYDDLPPEVTEQMALLLETT